MEQDKQYTDGIVIKKGKFLTWLDNYWYHYKWATLIVAFFLIVFSICIIQACTAEHDDLKVVYAGEAQLDANQHMEIEKLLTEYLPEEFGKTEDTNASLTVYTILSTKTEKPIYEEDADGKKVYATDENGKIIYATEHTFNSDQFNNLISNMQTGTGSVVLMDKWLYDEMIKASKDVDRFMPLVHVFGTKPACAIDDYAIYLSDTQMFNDNEAVFSCLPDDTVIVLLSELLYQKNYDKEQIAFEAYAAVAESAK